MTVVYSIPKFLEPCLIALTLGGFIYIGYFFFTQTGDPVETAFNSVPGGETSNNVDLMFPPYTDYARQIQARDIFTFSAAAVSAEGSAVQTPTGELPPHLKVVGILLGNPAQVVVEDTNAHETHFLQQGKKEGDLRFDRVEKNKIYLNYQGQGIAVFVKEGP